jgi:CRISPR-associated protein Cas2
VALTFVVAYDISEDRRRSRVAASVEQWGDRVQKSVFVVTLDTDQLADLLARVTEMIDTSTDSVYAFRQCAACWGHRRRRRAGDRGRRAVLLGCPVTITQTGVRDISGGQRSWWRSLIRVWPLARHDAPHSRVIHR